MQRLCARLGSGGLVVSPSPVPSRPLQEYNPFDHAIYMGFNALDGIPHGCMYTDPDLRGLRK